LHDDGSVSIHYDPWPTAVGMPARVWGVRHRPVQIAISEALGGQARTSAEIGGRGALCVTKGDVTPDQVRGGGEGGARERDDGGKLHDGETRVPALISGENATANMAGAAHPPTQPAKEAHWAMILQSGLARLQPQATEVLAVIMGEPVHALADAMPASGANAETTVRNRTSNVRRRCIKNPKMGKRLRSALAI
jgi:hypothetical protein